MAAGPTSTTPAQNPQFNTTVSYLTHFYPLWFTHNQNHNTKRDNGLVGPIRVSPLHPDAKRFWSFTAYTPQSIELVKNSLKKYAVARYTPNLQYGGDGSVTIYMSNVQPKDAPQSNWLPAPTGPVNVMLRVYGPEGSVADGTYVPPGIVKQP